jgi:hypothetical protein
MNATKTQFLDDLETEFGAADAPTGPPRRAARGRSTLRRRLIASGFAASILGGLLVFNAAPAAASYNCLAPDFVQYTHWKTCSPLAAVKHRYVRTETHSSGGHVMTCHYFYSSLRGTCAEDDYDSNACRAA